MKIGIRSGLSRDFPAVSLAGPPREEVESTAAAATPLLSGPARQEVEAVPLSGPGVVEAASTHTPLPRTTREEVELAS